MSIYNIITLGFFSNFVSSVLSLQAFLRFCAPTHEYGMYYNGNSLFINCIQLIVYTSAKKEKEIIKLFLIHFAKYKKS